MKVLVTGGGGFLGRHIVEKLLARGDQVRVLGRRSYFDLAHRGVECVKADIIVNDAVVAACDGVDAVFHVAARAGIWGDYKDYYDSNVRGAENVIDACIVHGVKKLVYTSTPSVVYGRESISGGDESLPYPDKFLTAYAATKAEAERRILIANEKHKVNTCALRPHLVWGPGDTNLIPRLIKKAKAGKLRQVGDGHNTVSASYVENVADAHLAACDRLEEDSPVCGQAYFISDEPPVNCWKFINRLLEGLRCPPAGKPVKLKTAYALGAVLEAAYKLFNLKSEPPMTRFLALQLATSHWFKTDRARRDLGWSPAVGLDEGLRRTFDSYQKKDPA
jgi:nucleoside-diphosphate-sugar epimerase